MQCVTVFAHAKLLSSVIHCPSFLAKYKILSVSNENERQKTGGHQQPFIPFTFVHYFQMQCWGSKKKSKICAHTVQSTLNSTLNPTQSGLKLLTNLLQLTFSTLSLVISHCKWIRKKLFFDTGKVDFVHLTPSYSVTFLIVFRLSFSLE